MLPVGYGTKNGELARTQPEGGIHALKGYNFEDAIVISEKVVQEDIFTSRHY